MSEPATFMRWGVGGGEDGRQKTEGEGGAQQVAEDQPPTLI